MTDRMILNAVLGLMTCAMVSCDSSDKIKKLNMEILDQEAILKDVEKRLEKEEESIIQFQKWADERAKITETKRQLKLTSAELEQARVQTQDMEASIQKLHEEWNDYKNRYRRSVRGLAKGTMIDLSKTHGEKFRDVKITRITPTELRVFLTTGPKGIPYVELPERLQDRFQFSEAEARAYLLAVAKARRSGAGGRGKPLNADQEEANAGDRVTEVANLIAAKKQEISSLRRRIKLKQLEAERLEERARDWNIRNHNTKARNGSSVYGAKARKASEMASDIRVQISDAKELINKIKREIGELIKGE